MIQWIQKRKNLYLTELMLLLLAIGVTIACSRTQQTASGTQLAVAGGKLDESGTAVIDADSQFAGAFVTAQFTDLPRGNYEAVIHYNSAYDDNGILLQSSNTDYGSINTDVTGNPVPLYSYRTEQNIHVRLGESTKQLTALVNYCGAGTLSVTDITLRQLPDFTAAAVLLLLFVLLDLDLTLSGKDLSVSARQEKRMVVFGILAITVLASLPLLNDFQIASTDLYYHMRRIQGLADGLLSGQFPVRVQPTWWFDYGGIASVFYPDLFLYFPAVLVNLGYGVQTALKCYLVLMNLATAWIAWYCFKRLSGNDRAGLFGSFLYTLALYRLENVYARGAFGEFTALTFLPLVVLGLWEIYYEENALRAGQKAVQTAAGRESRRPVGWLTLALGLSGCLESHILTCEMVAVFLILFCILMIRKTFTRTVFTGLLKAAGVTLLLNAWFLVPFLNLVRDPYQVSTLPQFNSPIQSSGAFWSQMFDLVIHGLANDKNAADGTFEEIGQSVGMGLGAVLLLMVAICLIYREKLRDDPDSRRYRRAGITAAGFGVLSLILVSNSFPYDALYHQSTMMATLLGHLQFPWRFLSMATLFLSITGVFVFLIVGKLKGSTAQMTVSAFLALLVLVSMGTFYYQVTQSETVLRRQQEFDSYHTQEMTFYEYLINGTDTKQLDHQVHVSSQDVQTTDYQRQYTTVSLNVSNAGQQEGYVEVPLFFYPCYKAVGIEEAGAAKTELALSYGTNNVIRITVPSGFHGEIRLQVQERKLWRMSEAISWISVLVILGWYFLPVFLQHRKTQQK